jgi:hypothetical protein
VGDDGLALGGDLVGGEEHHHDGAGAEDGEVDPRDALAGGGGGATEETSAAAADRAGPRVARLAGVANLAGSAVTTS